VPCSAGEFDRATGRVRFSLIVLLLFVTLVCLVLAWLVQPRHVVATALFHVRRSPTPILKNDEATALNEQEFDIVKKTQLAVITSYFVLQKALRDPSVAALPVLAGQTDPAAWLQERIEVQYPQDAEILAISLSGREEFSNDLVLIVNAVAKAYLEEVVYAAQQRRLALRDMRAQAARKLRDELAEKMQQHDDLLSETRDNIETVEQRLLKVEIDVLMEQWRELSRDVERENIEVNSPRRIELIQNAVIRPAD
jgi:hypothetical protein